MRLYALISGILLGVVLTDCQGRTPAEALSTFVQDLFREALAAAVT